MENKPEVSIRPATAADISAIGRLGALLVREHNQFDPKRFIAETSQTAERYGGFIGTQLDERDAIVLVAERAGAVAGYAYATLEGYDYMTLRGPAGVLQDIVVDPAHQGQGIGRLILDAIIAALNARGAPRLVLSTAEKNEPAQRLFERAGFRRTMIEMTRELGESSSKQPE